MLLCCVSAIVSSAQDVFDAPTITGVWAHAFGDLECTENVSAASSSLLAPNKTLLTWPALETLQRAYRDTWMPLLTQPAHWPLQHGRKLSRRVATLLADDVTLPFVQRLELPVASRVAVFGDLHGSLHSFLRVLAGMSRDGWLRDDFTVACSECFLLFLGDYVDRGPHGAEVLALLLLLKSLSPDRVFMVRGNHEDARENAPDEDGTFVTELRAKFPNLRWRRIATLFRVYETLPLAIVVSTSNTSVAGPRFILAVHGGIEVGHDLRPLLQVAMPERLRSGAAIAFEPIQGLYRRAWLARQPAHIRERIPSALRAHLQNIGPAKKQRELLHEEEVDTEAVTVSCAGGDCSHRVGRKASQRDAQQRMERDLEVEYPTAPTGTEPPNGYMWWDFVASPPGASDVLAPFVTYREGRGFAFGRALTQHALAEAGLLAVFRAHQHNDNPVSGPMMTCVRQARGIFDNWNRSGHALTWLTGAHIPGMRFPFDSYGVLHLRTALPSSWRLQHCVHAVEATWNRPAAGWDEVGLPPHLRHAGVSRMCDPGHLFQCDETLWRAAGVKPL